MKPPIFIDTSYLLALVNRRDKYHEAAKVLAGRIEPPFVTSDAVLFEVGNALSRPPFRKLGISTLRHIRQDQGIEVVTVDAPLFEETVKLFQQRPDQNWGLTDCSSFVIMHQRGIRQALTADKHFEQAGFVRLLT